MKIIKSLVLAGVLATLPVAKAAPHTGMSNLLVCPVKKLPTFLCDRVTNTSPAYECAVCTNADTHGCLSYTSIYCVRSCDVAECVARK